MEYVRSGRESDGKSILTLCIMHLHKKRTAEAVLSVFELCPGILGGIGQILGLVPGDVLHAQVLEHFEQELSAVSERNSAVMRIALLHQHVAVETAHFLDGKDADAAEAHSHCPSLPSPRSLQHRLSST